MAAFKKDLDLEEGPNRLMQLIRWQFGSKAPGFKILDPTVDCDHESGC